MPRSFIVLVISLGLVSHAWSAVTVILATHAEVTSRGADGPLSASGRVRAQQLANALRDLTLDAIYVSNLESTHQTAQITAAGHRLQWQEKPDRAELAEILRQRTSGAVLIVADGRTVPQIISMLGGPPYEIAEGDFSNLFILSISQGQTSAVRLHYGTVSPGTNVSLGASERKSIMQISFVKSGGFAGALSRVQGIIKLSDGSAQVTGDAAYHRELAKDETQMLRDGAEPGLLSQAVARLDAARAGSRGMGDVEHYTVNVKTSDGKTHNVTFNTSGSSSEIEGMPPATAKFLSWLRQEAQNILSAKMK